MIVRFDVFKIFVLLFLGIFYLSLSVSAQDVVKEYPVKYNADKSSVFKVSVNGREIFTEDYKDVHYVNFGFAGKAEITVTVSEKVNKAEISPRRFEIRPEVKGDQISFTIEKPSKLVAYINNLERLFIFADGIENESPEPGDENIVSIEKYSVDNTGKTLSTSSIQKAIDECATFNKILFFPAGVYLIGTLNLRTNSNIYLEYGAVLLGSPDRKDYPQDAGFNEADQVNDPDNYTNKGWKMTYSRLILIGEAENVKLWGRGIIDGQGAKLRPQGKPANLIRVRNSKNILVKGLLLRDPAAWNTHILASDGVTFQDIKMINDRNVFNTDGIDPDGSRNVTVDNCFMYCSDDNIAIKTSGNTELLQPAENILVKNCVFITKKSAMKLGTETRADIRNVTFDNNSILECDRGMSLYSRDGSVFENIHFTNNHFERLFEDNQQRILQFELGDRAVDDAPGYVRRAGQIKNVLIENCVYDYKGNKESNIDGFDENHKISGVQFKNLIIQGTLCKDLKDAWIKINKFTEDVTFEVTEQKNN
ncbi:MAG TPA: glycosyl hydrolase family 28 protein [Melioribacteraceae bacterium]|nr:glycosyl hydrolase family 28 protein [Melioribacteraceae bacterium]